MSLSKSIPVRLGTLTLTWINNNVWKIAKPYSCDLYDRGVTVVVPVGFVTDLATFAGATLVLRGFLRPNTQRSSVLHDYGVRYGGYVTVMGEFIPMERKEIDKIFYYGLRYDSNGEVKSKALYLGVRLFDICRNEYKGKRLKGKNFA